MQMAAPTPEKAFVYTLLPLAVHALLEAITQQAMLPAVEAGIRADPQLAGLPASQALPAPLAALALATARASAVQQWSDCSVLVSPYRCVRVGGNQLWRCAASGCNCADNIVLTHAVKCCFIVPRFRVAHCRWARAGSPWLQSSAPS